MFIIVKTNNIQLRLLHKNNMRISTTEKHIGICNSNTLSPEKKDNIFHIIDQIKVARVLL